MYRVVMATIKHESNTFNRFPTTLDHFKRQGYRRDEEVLKAFSGARLEMSGFIDAARDFGWDAVTPIAVHANSGGRVSVEAYADFMAVLEAALIAHHPLDGVLLALHGAMVADGEDDADGATLERVRALVGRSVPVAVTLDLHANVSDRMAAAANILVSYRTNPHVDHYETALKAAELLQQAMETKVLPQTVVRRTATLVGFDRGRTHTGRGPMHDTLAMARQIEAEDSDILFVSVNAGFSHADVWEAGPSVTVTGVCSAVHLQDVAARLLDEGFRRRGEETVRLLSVAEAIDAATQGAPGQPAIIADYTDAPGGGSYGDSTVLLRALVESRMAPAAYGAIWDPPAAAAAVAAGVGSRLLLKIGGWIDPAFSGSPLESEVEVIAVSDGRYVHEGPYGAGTIGTFGTSALVRIGTVDCIVSTENRNIVDRQQFLIFGLDPHRQAVVGLKCMHGFRAGFEPGAGTVVACDAGGLVTYDYSKFDYLKLRRPIWPIDAMHEPYRGEDDDQSR